MNLCLIFFLSLTKSVFFGSLHSKILKFRLLVDVSGNKGYDNGKKLVEIIIGLLEKRNIV